MTINLKLILNDLIKGIWGYWSLNISYFSFFHIITVMLTGGKNAWLDRMFVQEAAFVL